MTYYSQKILSMLLEVCCCITLWSVLMPTAHANVIQDPLSLMGHDGNSLQIYWIDNGPFADILWKDVKNYCVNYDEEQTSRDLNIRLSKFHESIQITFTPQIIIKPFILVEELRDLLVVYKSKQYRKNLPINENFQFRALSLSQTISHIKKIISERSQRALSLSPYHNRIYGLYLEIHW